MRACALDYSQFSEDWKGESAFPALIAAAIVHEATHGLIRRRYRARNVAGELREEAVCHKEEWRCFERIVSASGVEVDEDWLADCKRFDARWHRVYWSRLPFRGARRKVRRLINRLGRGGS